MTRAYLLVAQVELCNRCLRPKRFCATHGCDPTGRHKHRATTDRRPRTRLLVGVGASVVLLAWLACAAATPGGVHPLTAAAVTVPAENPILPPAALTVSLPPVDVSAAPVASQTALSTPVPGRVYAHVKPRPATPIAPVLAHVAPTAPAVAPPVVDADGDLDGDTPTRSRHPHKHKERHHG